jgi:uncharacterized protein YacL
VRRDYHTLDAIVVCAALVLLGLGGWALVTREIPQAALPIVASLVTGVLGIIMAYTGARWGNKKPSTTEEMGTTVTTPPGPSTLTVETPAKEQS